MFILCVIGGLSGSLDRPLFCFSAISSQTQYAAFLSNVSLLAQLNIACGLVIDPGKGRDPNDGNNAEGQQTLFLHYHIKNLFRSG